MAPSQLSSKFRVLALILLIFLVEWTLELADYLNRSKVADQINPFYSFELESQEGSTISVTKGLLKLQLDPSTLYRNKPDQKTPYFTINHEGFREVPVNQNTVIKYKAALIGGSTAFSTGSLSDASTYAASLASEIPGLEITNAAVIGYTAQNELSTFTTRLIEKKLDVLIALSGWNDFVQWLPDGRTSSFVEQLERQLKWSLNYRDSNPIGRYYYGLLQTFFPIMHGRVMDLFDPEIEIRVPIIGTIRNSVVIRNPAESSKQYLKTEMQIKNIADSLKIPFCIILQPDINAIMQLRLKTDILGSADYNKFRDFVVEGAKETSLSVFDTGVADSPLLSEYFLDAMHLNEIGNRELAKMTAKFVQSCIKNKSPNF